MVYFTGLHKQAAYIFFVLQVAKYIISLDLVQCQGCHFASTHTLTSHFKLSGPAGFTGRCTNTTNLRIPGKRQLQHPQLLLTAFDDDVVCNRQGLPRAEHAAAQGQGIGVIVLKGHG